VSGCEMVHLAQDRVEWGALTNIKMGLWAPRKGENFPDCLGDC